MDDFDDYMPSFKQNEEINNNYERSSMDCPISSSNIGYKLLQKMGWTEGKGLGPELQGILILQYIQNLSYLIY